MRGSLRWAGAQPAGAQPSEVADRRRDPGDRRVLRGRAEAEAHGRVDGGEGAEVGALPRPGGPDDRVLVDGAVVLAASSTSGPRGPHPRDDDAGDRVDRDAVRRGGRERVRDEGVQPPQGRPPTEVEPHVEAGGPELIIFEDFQCPHCRAFEEAMGPTISGAILQVGSWRMIFGVMLPIALGMLFLGFVYVWKRGALEWE